MIIRFEYKVWYAEGRASELQTALTEAGREGWHLQDVIPADKTTPAMLILTRPYIVSTDENLIPDYEEVRG